MSKRVYRLRIELNHCTKRCPNYIHRTTSGGRYSKPQEITYCSTTGKVITGDVFSDNKGNALLFPEFCPLDNKVDE